MLNIDYLISETRFSDEAEAVRYCEALHKAVKKDYPQFAVSISVLKAPTEPKCTFNLPGNAPDGIESGITTRIGELAEQVYEQGGWK